MSSDGHHVRLLADHKALIQAMVKANMEQIEVFVTNNPELLELYDWHGNTPLHIASFERVQPLVIRFILQRLEKENVAVVLTLRDELKRTPLHTAISSVASEEVIELLFRANPETIGMTDFADATPLSLAVCVGLSPRLIRVMMELNSQAIRFVGTTNQRTVLHEACQSAQHLSVYQALVKAWPTACLRLDEYGKSPYDEALRKMQDNDTAVIDCMLQSTHEVACALMEVILTCILVDDNGTTHSSRQRILSQKVRQLLQDLPVDSTITNPQVLVQVARPHLSQMHLRKLLQWIQQQEQEQKALATGWDNCVNSVYHMNVAGRRYMLDDPGNKRKALAVLQSVSDNVAGLYWHVREHPTVVSFFCALTIKKSSPTTK